jgi:acyl-CoA synthetase (AMP-forming)/AMP-acid ligase II
MSGLFEQLQQKAKQNPRKKALIKPTKAFFTNKYHYESIDFEELVRRCLCFENGLRKLSIERGTRTLVFVKPGMELAPLTFALFKIGAVPVFIDPGMGKKNLLDCIKKAKPEAMVAEPILAVIQKIYPESFKTVKQKIYTQGSWFFYPKYTLRGFLNTEAESLSTSTKESTSSPAQDELAALLFTSGGTGRPKGVCYTHKIFETQTKMLQEMFKLGSEDVDCPGFPLFSLFTLSMGATNAIPDLDATKPAQCKAERLIQNITDQKATFVAGSPAIWERVADECIRQEKKLPSVKSVVMFGAPVSLDLHRKFREILPNGTTYTPYGATEALPVALTSGKAILDGPDQKMKNGHGTYLGKPVPGVEIKIIKITDQIEEQIKELPIHTLGEIIVKGDCVTRFYDGMPEQTQLAKILTTEGFWHRMGDIGHLDENGELWFCGRKSHRVQTATQTLFSIPCESIFNQHPEIKRTALIGPLTNQRDKSAAGLVIETINQKNLTTKEKQKIIDELKELGSKHHKTKEIQAFYFCKAFPVDVRHNIKIDRNLLTSWANNAQLQQ